MTWTRCRTCDAKDQEIARLAVKGCQTCLVRADEILYLREQVKTLRQERQVERDEFKRAIDRMIEAFGGRAVGQGIQAPASPLSARDVIDGMGIFQESDAR